MIMGKGYWVIQDNLMFGVSFIASNSGTFYSFDGTGYRNFFVVKNHAL